ncbi:MAG: hypothetical protein V4736_15375 [Bdellovibrionota bacterium]
MKKSILICIVSLVASLLFVLASYADELPWTYTQLTTKDLTEMNQMVRNGIKEANKQTPADPEVLKSLTRSIFMRPNKDRMIDKVFGELRSALEANEILESTFSFLVSDAIEKLKDENTKPRDQVSYIIFLENFIAEHKAESKENAYFKKEFEKIRDAKIEVSKKAASERKLRLMEESKSPSLIAEAVLGKAK